MMIARLLFPVVHQDRRRGMMRKKSVGTAAPAAVVAAAGRVAKTGRVIAERERETETVKSETKKIVVVKCEQFFGFIFPNL